MTAVTDTEPPRIYAASLSDYNAGHLHGAWIDCTGDLDAIRSAITDMLAAAPTPGAEEWAIHDHEGFHGWPVGEYADLEEVHQVAEAIAEHGPAVAAYLANGFDLDGFGDDYCGEWASEVDYAQQLAEDVGAITGDEAWPLNCIDWERAARDLFMGDYWSADCTGGVYVFRVS